MSKYEKIVWISILIYALAFGLTTSLRHYNFQTQTGDMAIFVNTMWNTIHGRAMRNTLEEVPNTLGVHMSPILFLLAPLYWLFTSPYTLLILQTITVALGALPLFYLARKILENEKLAASLAIGYLMYPGLEWANFYDFHPITFFPTLFLTGFYFAYEKKWLPAAIFLALAAATREDAILVVASAGIYFLIKGRQHDTVKRVASRNISFEPSREATIFSLSMIILAIIYFIISVKILMPHFGGGLLRLDRYEHLGGSAGEIAKNIFFHPALLAQTLLTGDKFIYLFWLLAPLGFLPLLARAEWLIIIPGLAENLLTNYRFQFSGLYQYDTILVGSLFIAAIYGAKNLLALKPGFKKYAGSLILIAAAAGFILHSPIKPIGFPIALFKSNPHWTTLREIMKKVPADASVAAHTNLVPHLAHREKIYLLGREPAPADIVLIDGADYFGFESPAELEAYVDRHMISGRYTMEVIQNRYFILKKK